MLCPVRARAFASHGQALAPAMLGPRWACSTGARSDGGAAAHATPSWWIALRAARGRGLVRWGTSGRAVSTRAQLCVLEVLRGFGGQWGGGGGQRASGLDSPQAAGGASWLRQLVETGVGGPRRGRFRRTRKACRRLRQGEGAFMRNCALTPGKELQKPGSAVAGTRWRSHTMVAEPGQSPDCHQGAGGCAVLRSAVPNRAKPRWRCRSCRPLTGEQEQRAGLARDWGTRPRSPPVLDDPSCRAALPCAPP